MILQNFNNGSNLIFLISQPRSGSTLLQRILGSHPDIHTQSEPWILLHPLFPLKYESIVTPYNSWLYSLGLKDFIGSLPNGEEQYRHTITSAFVSLYQSILHDKKKHLFLDKTPRYFHIINELHEYFPEAKFIFLLRNPVAVITSVIKTFTGDDWNRLSDFRHDLLFAPRLILDGKMRTGTSAHSLKFEDLLENPESQITNICEFLEVDYSSSLLNYGRKNQPKWRFGDQDNAYSSLKPGAEVNNKWIGELKDPQIWRVVSDYIQMLGRMVLESMNYDFDQLTQHIHQNKPTAELECFTTSLDTLLKNEDDRIIENHKVKRQIFELNSIIKHKDRIIAEQKNQIQELIDKLQQQ